MNFPFPISFYMCFLLYVCVLYVCVGGRVLDYKLFIKFKILIVFYFLLHIFLWSTVTLFSSTLEILVNTYLKLDQRAFFFFLILHYSLLFLLELSC